MNTLNITRRNVNNINVYDFTMSCNDENYFIATLRAKFAPEFFNRTAKYLNFSEVEYIDQTGTCSIPEFLGVYMEDYSYKNFKIIIKKEAII